MRQGVTGIELDGGLELVDCFRQPLRDDQSGAKTVSHRRIAGLGSCRRGVVVDRLPGTAHSDRLGAKIAVRRGITGVRLQRLPEVRGSLLVPAGFDQNDPEIVVREPAAGISLKRGFVELHGVAIGCALPPRQRAQQKEKSRCCGNGRREENHWLTVPGNMQLG